jgi:serine/threonine-protein kinase RIO1
MSSSSNTSNSPILGNTNISPSLIISGKENGRYPNTAKHATSTINNNNNKTTSAAMKQSSRSFSLLQPYTLQQQQHPDHESYNKHSPVSSNDDPIYDRHTNNRGSITKATTKRSPLLDLQTPQTRHTKTKDRPPRSMSSSQRKRNVVIGPTGGYSVSAAIPSSTSPNGLVAFSPLAVAAENTPSPEIGTSLSGDADGQQQQVSVSVSSSNPVVSGKGKNPVLRVQQTRQNHSQQQRQQRRVLLFGETMESLFCIQGDLDRGNKPSSEIVRLAQSIVDGSQTHNPSTWRRVLQLVIKQYELQHQQGHGRESATDMLRLHRRATLWFPLDEVPCPVIVGDNDIWTKKFPIDDDDILHIWLSFARVQEICGSVDEARRTYQFMENQKIPCCRAAFYLDWADFEKRQPKTQLTASRHRPQPQDEQCPTHVLLRGIRRKGEPLADLEVALNVYEKDAPSSTDTTAAGLDSTSSRVRFASPNNGVEQKTTLKRQLLHKARSPKRQKKIGNVLGPSQMSNENDETQTEKTSSIAQTSNTDAEGRDLSKVNSARNLERTTLGNTRRARSPATVAESNEPNKSVSAFTTKKSTPKRKPSLSSRLSCKRLSGKAKRVDAEQSFLSLGDDDDESDDESDNNNDSSTNLEKTHDSQPVSSGEPRSSSKKTGNSKSSVPRFNKADLSYMWEWDPTERLKKKEDHTQQQPTTEDVSSSSSGESSGTSQNITTQNIHPRKGEEQTPSNGQLIVEKKAIVNQKIELEKPKPLSQSSSNIPLVVPSNISHARYHERQWINSKNSDAGHDKRLKINEKDNSIQLKKQALLNKANLEFLPLVNENNILHVNGAAYAKLGVIGKGGSSKVYRALSKKCSVVGIKKVKLDGMDDRAIEGYANEISLLKRLKGNPAIIQMYDSQVDLQRKSIFVVMELGEVDLNQVLKQRAISETSRSLNLNFIRLTWQQMLSAVHCIHEERIIHSDLKPANFLFVRGALKLIDFGIAKAITNENTTSIYRENHIGTLNYMSPEAILDTGSGDDGPRMKIGRASDVWSLGCILYEMVYGKTPFANLHFIQKLQAITNPKHVIEFPPEGDEAAVDAMKLCLRREPEERPPIVGNGGLLDEHWFLHSKRRTVPTYSSR